MSSKSTRGDHIHEGEHPLSHQVQISAAVIFFIVWVIDSFFIKQTLFLADFVHIYFRLAIGGIIIAVALMLMISASNRFEEMAGNPELLMDKGAFAFVRHPLYLAPQLLCWSLAIMTGSLAAMVACIIALVMLDRIATFEEKKLEVKFGQPYLDYCKRTGKWFPKFRK